MTPEEFASRHPKLYHVTSPGAWPAISKLGLLPTEALLELLEKDQDRRTKLSTSRRPTEVRLEHPTRGTAILNDNLPLSERALTSCLDDGLTPKDWLRMLNARVFFWADADGLDRLLGAKMNRGRLREILVFDTLGLVRAHADRVEISPINSGATIRKPARRGLTTFTPILATSYDAWRRQRGKKDRVVEVTVCGGVPDIARYLVETRTSAQ
jgi:hypothetical protein